MSSFPQTGETFAKRYELIEVVGTGGLSTVFKARQKESNRSIALKILHEDAAADRDFIKRFLREAKALSQLDHAGIVKIYHLGSSEEGLPFIAMELVRGKNLNQLLKEEGKIPVLRAIKIVRRCAEALTHIHQNGILHRDLKPANIGILDKPEPDTIKILDFGLSRFSYEQKSTKTGTVIGSVNYMSPEQCMGKEVDARSDIYALTLCFYEMIAGEKPFSAENPVGMMYQHMNSPVPKLSATEISPFVPELNTFMAKGLAKKADDRFASADVFIKELDRLQDKLERAAEAKAPVTRQDLKYTFLGAGICAILLAGFLVFQQSHKSKEPAVSAAKISTKVTLERAIEILESRFRRREGERDEDKGWMQKQLQEYLDAPKLESCARACLLAGLAQTYQYPELLTKDELLARADDAARREHDGIRDRLLSESYTLARSEYERRHDPRSLRVFLACGASLAQRLVDTAKYSDALSLIELLIKIEMATADKLPQYDPLEGVIHPYSIPHLEVLKCRALYGKNEKQAADRLLDKLARRHSPPFEVGALLEKHKTDEQIAKLITELSEKGDPESLIDLSIHFIGSDRTVLVEKFARALKPFAMGGAIRYGLQSYARIELARISSMLNRKQTAEAGNNLKELAALLSGSELDHLRSYQDPFTTCTILELMHKINMRKEAHEFLIANYKSLSSDRQSKYPLSRLVAYADRDQDLANLLRDSGAEEESKRESTPSILETDRLYYSRRRWRDPALH